MTENLSNEEFVTLYRGRNHYWWDPLDPKRGLHGLGMHWTANPKIAGHFAVGGNDSDWDEKNEEGHTPMTAGGHIIVAKVPKSGIIEPHTEEWNRLAGDHGIMTPEDSVEEETTVRPGTPVELQRVIPVKGTGFKFQDNANGEGWSGFTVGRSQEFNNAKGSA
jgi:hypothetical protein